MKILVTGATGFVGSHVARALLRLGHEVTLFHRKSSKLDILEGDEARMGHAIGDLGDAESCLAAARGQEAVFHVAGDVDQGDGDVERQYRINVQGTRNICEGALQHRIRRFVHTSSVSAIGYSPYGAECDETTPFNFGPLGLTYMETKNQAEFVVQEYVRRGLNAVIVNPSTLYGPGDRKSLMAESVRAAAMGRMPAVPSGGMNWVYVDDVTSCHLLAFEKGRTGERYIAAGENMAFLEFARRIARLNGRRGPLATIPPVVSVAGARVIRAASWLTRRPPPFSVPSARVSAERLYYSSRKAVSELGYRITPFDEGMKRTLAWMRHAGYLKD
ncbi:MAG: SDR family oxidoreductase [Deltaproteobacteria bacterium]|nr:SDR family oxidoreductase [Deltaproteobacteria bacterium]